MNYIPLGKISFTTPFYKDDDSSKSNPTPSTAVSNDSPLQPSPFSSYGLFNQKALMSNINVNNMEDSKVILKSNSHLDLTQEDDHPGDF